MIRKKIAYWGFIGLLAMQTNVMAQEMSTNTSTNEVTVVKKAEMQDARNAVMALNHMHASLNKIVLYNDKIILEDEYDNIINNINLTVIDDKETVDLITRLMDTLSAFKLTELEKEKFEADYEENLDEALVDAIVQIDRAKIVTIGAAVATANPMAVVQVLQLTGGAYKNYQKNIDDANKEFDKSKWKLKKDVILELNTIRKEFLVTYWKLMKKYDIPDKWRITEKQLTRLVAILKEDDNDKKLRQLLRLKDELAVSPTYWYDLSLTAYQANNKEIVLDALKKYELLDDRLLRHNSQYSLMLANKITYMNAGTQKDEIRAILEKIQEIDPLNPERKLFLAMEYELIGDTKKAELILNENIDDNFLPALSKKLKLDLYLQEKDLDKYQATIKQLLEQHNLSVIEYLDYLGKQPVEVLAKEIDKEIKQIAIKINRSLYGKDSLLIFLSKKWVLHNVKDINLVVILDDKEYKASSISKTDDIVIYTYKDMIPYSDIKEKRIKSISLKMVNSKLPVTISYNIEITKPSIDKADENKEDSNASSILDNSISALYSNSAKAYNKGIEIYGDLRSEIQFVPAKLNIGNKCFDMVDNLSPCK